MESKRLTAVAPLPWSWGRQGEAIHPDQLPLNMPDVSSSEIRQRARQGRVAQRLCAARDRSAARRGSLLSIDRASVSRYVERPPIGRHILKIQPLEHALASFEPSIKRSKSDW